MPSKAPIPKHNRLDIPIPNPAQNETQPLTKAERIRQALLRDPDLNPDILAAELHTDQSVVRKERRRLRLKQAGGDESSVWGAMISSRIPLSLQAKVLKQMLTSDNPVAQARALELVLESRGLRKKTSEPSKQSSIIVESGGDSSFD